MDWINLAPDWTPVASSCEHCNVPSSSIKDGKYLDQLSDYRLLCYMKLVAHPMMDSKVGITTFCRRQSMYRIPDTFLDRSACPRLGCAMNSGHSDTEIAAYSGCHTRVHEMLSNHQALCFAVQSSLDWVVFEAEENIWTQVKIIQTITRCVASQFSGTTKYCYI
jgi:hypothetical protein